MEYQTPQVRTWSICHGGYSKVSAASMAGMCERVIMSAESHLVVITTLGNPKNQAHYYIVVVDPILEYASLLRAWHMLVNIVVYAKRHHDL